MPLLRALGALGGYANVRYGGYSLGGPDPLSKFLAMDTGQLRNLDCVLFRENADVIAAGAPQFTAAQRKALAARARECATNNPWLPDFIENPVESVSNNVTSALSSAGQAILSGAGVVIGNAVIALAGLALIVMGVGRMFGQNPAKGAVKTAAKLAL